VIAGGLATAGFAVGLVAAMLDDGVNGVNAALGQKAVGGIVIATMAWLVWRVTVYPCVQVTESRLTVRQPFSTYEAPWHAVGEPDALHGLRLPLAGHGVVKPWAFSASILSDFTGDRFANSAMTSVDEMRRGAARDAQTVERRWNVGVLTLALTWAIALTVAVLASVA
jgi:hypothetical protein